MANNFKFELNKEGVRQLLQGKEMQQALITYAKTVQNRAGDGYSVHVGRNRANVSVRTNDDAAVKDNLEKNTLLRSLHK